jgi:hypothetical protein
VNKNKAQEESEYQSIGLNDGNMFHKMDEKDGGFEVDRGTDGVVDDGIGAVVAWARSGGGCVVEEIGMVVGAAASVGVVVVVGCGRFAPLGTLGEAGGGGDVGTSSALGPVFLNDAFVLVT